MSLVLLDRSVYYRPSVWPLYTVVLLSFSGICMYQARVLKLTCEDRIIKLTTCDNIGIRTFCKVVDRLQK